MKLVSGWRLAPWTWQRARWLAKYEAGLDHYQVRSWRAW